MRFSCPRVVTMCAHFHSLPRLETGTIDVEWPSSYQKLISKFNFVNVNVLS